MREEFKFIFKSNQWTVISIVFGVMITIIYKIWKWYLRSALGLSPKSDYFEYEIYSTLFRALGVENKLITRHEI